MTIIHVKLKNIDITKYKDIPIYIKYLYLRVTKKNISERLL